MGIISWIVWGLVVGAVARLLVPGRQKIGFLWTIVLGVAGSLIGGFIATEVLDIADTDEFDFGSFLIAIAGSAVLLLIWERVEAGRQRRKPAEGA